MNQQIFENIRQLKRELIPNERLILFGSQARGDARSNSDWDLLLLLNKNKKEFEDEDVYGYPFAEMGLKYGTYMSVKIFTENDWKKMPPSLFRCNIEREGIEIT